MHTYTQCDSGRYCLLHSLRTRVVDYIILRTYDGTTRQYCTRASYRRLVTWRKRIYVLGAGFRLWRSVEVHASSERERLCLLNLRLDIG